MNSNGLFIEYFISGGFSLLWIYPLLKIFGIEPCLLELNVKIFIVAIPFTYVVGMLVDFYASFLLKKLKLKYRNNIYHEHEVCEHLYYETIFELTSYNKDLVKHLEMRDSRVRASRGIFFNFIISLIIIPLFFILANKIAIVICSIIILIGLTISSGLMWKKMLRLSILYQAKMLKLIEIENKKKSHRS